MKKRNHELYVGEVVWDDIQKYFGVITELGDNYAKLDMNAPCKDVRAGWCEDENRKMFDEEIPEEEMTWVTHGLEYLYQICWDLVDSREQSVVCYEHNELEKGYDYPYYSPLLEENLYTFETEGRVWN